MNTTAAAIAQLTAKGRETMEAIGLRKLSFFDEGIVAGSGSWGGNLAGEMGHKSSGVINRLRDMGLFETDDVEDDDMWWTLTELGAAVANELARPTQTEELPLELDTNKEGTDMNSTEFAVSTSRDGSTKIHKTTCKKQPKNTIPATSAAWFDEATPASCCKPKFEAYAADLKAAEKQAQDEPVTVTVAWTPNTAKLFFRALAKDGTRTIAEALGVEHKSNESRLQVILTGDALVVAELAEMLPNWWDGMNEDLRLWRTTLEYKSFNLQDKQGAKDAFQAEQDLLRQMSRKLAGWLLANDGEITNQRVWAF